MNGGARAISAVTSTVHHERMNIDQTPPAGHLAARSPLSPVSTGEELDSQAAAGRALVAEVPAQVLVTTHTAVYLLDPHARTATRHPRQDAHEPAAFMVARLRRDGEVVPLLAVLQLQIGWPMILGLDVRGDGLLTVRCSTPVVVIEPVDTPGDSQELDTTRARVGGV
jgi:hypothetical protein